MVWIEVTPEEARAARIEVKALRSAGLEPDPLVEALAEAQPHTAEWVKEQEPGIALGIQAQTPNFDAELVDEFERLLGAWVEPELALADVAETFPASRHADTDSEETMPDSDDRALAGEGTEKTFAGAATYRRAASKRRWPWLVTLLSWARRLLRR